ncbi:DUF2231 domain-containing protein [Allosphingosinicella humi]
MQRASIRQALAVAALLVMVAGTPALAHKTHEELGAGPGPSHAAMQKEQVPAKDVAGGMSMDAHEMGGSQMGMGHEHDIEDRRNKSFGERLVRWLGRLHTVIIHFPIAMIVGAFAVEIFGVWRGSTAYRESVRVMLVVGALGAVLAAFLGWFAGGFFLTDRNPILTIHRWLGTMIALATLLLVYLGESHRREPDRPRTVYWAMLAILTVVVSVQGFLGGTFMHGGLKHLAF